MDCCFLRFVHWAHVSPILIQAYRPQAEVGIMVNLARPFSYGKVTGMLTWKMILYLQNTSQCRRVFI